MLKTFLELKAKGYSVIPVGPDKRPLVAWKEFQVRIASDEEIRSWISNLPHAQVGIVTGKISGIVVVDVENGGDPSFLPPTTIARTGGGGWHYYYNYVPFNNKARIRELVDVRGDGGYVVAPGSKSNKGSYAWLEQVEVLPDFPIDLFVAQHNERALNCQQASGQDVLEYRGVSHGQRNDAMARYIGSILVKVHPSDWHTKAWSMAAMANQKNSPPLSNNELKAVFESITSAEKKKPHGKSEKMSKTVQLVDLLINAGAKPFLDQFGTPWVAINGDGSLIMRIQSRDFSNLLMKLMYDHKITAGKDTISQVVGVLSGKALSDNSKYKLHLRAAKDADGNHWYDLGDGRIIKFENGSWSIVNKPPIIFASYKHQGAQPIPENNGCLDDLMALINTANEYDQILLKIFIVTGFIGGFAHPVLVIHGQHGSAKSTLFRFIKDLIDPAQLSLVPPIKDQAQFIQVVAHNWVCMFDNLSGVKQDLSDSICRACTGGGFSKRELYTNDDDFIYDVQHIIGLNGINNVVVNSDLFDRSILVELARIPEEHRKTDQEINDQYNKIKPGLLGTCLKVAAKAMEIKPTIKLAKKYRMADFTVWGCAVAEALGIDKEKFLMAYERNAKLQNEESIENSPVALAVIELIKSKKIGIEAEATYILDQLNRINNCGLTGTHDKYWPSNSRSFGKKFREITPSLEKIGLRITHVHNQKRMISIEPTPEFWQRFKEGESSTINKSIYFAS